MKLRITLLASAAVLIAGQAMAADITSPFYLPQTGKFLSDASIQYRRFSADKLIYSGQGWYAKEKISYGVSDNLSVNAAIGNNFDNKYATLAGENFTYNNSHNFDYTLGAAYNYTAKQFLTQVYTAYNTFKPKSFLGDKYSNAWNKYVTLGAKIGYSLGNDSFIPYIDFKAVYGLNDVAYASDAYGHSSPIEGHWTYSTFVGVHKMWEVVSTDIGVRWDNVRHDLYSRNHSSRNDVYAHGSVNYFISEDMTVGLYGDYLIGDTYKGNINDDYTVGANFKFGF